MKVKRILITYLNNGNLKSQVAKEYLFNKIVNDLISENRVVEYEYKNTSMQFEKRVRFEDGSSVICVPFSLANKGMKVTHVFIDEELSKLPNGREIIYEGILPSVIRWETKEFDTSEKNRAFTFNYDNGALNLNTI
jgi:hypothetical protein